MSFHGMAQVEVVTFPEGQFSYKFEANIPDPDRPGLSKTNFTKSDKTLSFQGGENPVVKLIFKDIKWNPGFEDYGLVFMNKWVNVSSIVSPSFNDHVQKDGNYSMPFEVKRSGTLDFNIQLGISKDGTMQNATALPTNLNIRKSIKANAVLGTSADSDGDGIEDQDDECPELKGIAKFNGCPDSDNDGIIDPKDKCPNESGPAELDGCPDKTDSDGDGILDKQDSCPNLAGLSQFNGCPDTDKDGVQDGDDQCPNQAGTIENFGCPKEEKVEAPKDTDGDGVPDNKDQCPEDKGPAKHEGCPDKDKDRVYDNVDKCPDEIGNKKTDGCPDKDGDLVPDRIDNCPDIKGVRSNNGCPPVSNKISEGDAFEVAKRLNTFDDYNRYILDYPNGEFVNEARDSIRQIPIRYEIDSKIENDENETVFQYSLMDISQPKIIDKPDDNLLEAEIDKNNKLTLISKDSTIKKLTVTDIFERRIEVEVDPFYKVFKVFVKDNFEQLKVTVEGGEPPYFIRFVKDGTRYPVCQSKSNRAQFEIFKADMSCDMHGRYALEIQDARKKETKRYEWTLFAKIKSKINYKLLLLIGLMLGLGVWVYRILKQNL